MRKNRLSRIVLAGLLAFNLPSVNAQIFVSSSGMTVKSGSTLYFEGLALVPSSDLTLTSNTLSRSSTPITTGSKSSIKRVFDFSTAFTYAGSLQVYYDLATELNSNTASALQVAYSRTVGGGWATTSGSTANASDVYQSSFASGGLASISAFPRLANIWQGSSGASWSTGSNWSSGEAPTGGGDIDIASGTTNLDVDLTLASGNSLTLSGTGGLVIAPGKTLTIAGTADFGGKSVTLKSTADGTASIGQITGTLSGATNVTVERYIPLRTGRRYRLIAPSVNSTGTIRDNWMEGGLNTVVGTNVNPNPGYGVQITGTGGNTNGFDVTASNEASLYATNNGTTLTYSAVANTNANLNAYSGYFLFVRGDRSMNMTLPNTNVAPNPVPLATSATTLRSTGTLVTGTQTSFTNALSSTANAMNLITNPYASAINWADVYAASSNIKDYYTIWDPNIGFRGGFVTVTNTGTATPSDNTLSGTSGASTTIQPGQAFFVTTAANGAATVSIQEAHKVGTGGTPNAVFGTAGVLAPISSQLAVNLYYKEASGSVRLADGVRALFANGYQKTLDANDALEIANWDENLALLTSGKKLAVEARPSVNGYDTLALAVNNLKKMDYQLQVNASGFSNPLLQASLVDHFTQTTTPLSLSTATTVPFTVTADAASSSVSRFQVIFSTTTALPLKFRNFLGQVKGAQTKLEFEVETEANVVRYDIEKSNDGEGFASIGNLAPKSSANLFNSYQWADAARAGSSYYRIKAVSVDGSVQYSKVVKLTLGNSRANVQAYPNPLRGKDFTLQLDQLEAGRYRLDWYNAQGQLMNTELLQHPGGFYQHHPVVPATNGMLQWKLSNGTNNWKGTLIQ